MRLTQKFEPVKMSTKIKSKSDKITEWFWPANASANASLTSWQQESDNHILFWQNDKMTELVWLPNLSPIQWQNDFFKKLISSLLLGLFCITFWAIYSLTSRMSLSLRRWLEPGLISCFLPRRYFDVFQSHEDVFCYFFVAKSLASFPKIKRVRL